MIFVSSAALLFAGDMDTVATVKLIKTEPITVKQLRTEIELIEKITGQKVSSLEDRKKVLVDKMIPERLVLQAAERDKVYADEKAIDQQMNQLRAAVSSQLNRQITDADFAEAVRQQMGMDVPSYRAELKRQYIIQRYVYKYAQEKKGSLIQSIKEPTEAEIVNYYNLNKAKAVRPDTVRLTMIQIPYIDNDRKKAQEIGNNLAKEIGGNAVKFDQVSVRAGPSSGYRVGDPGPIPRNPEAQELFGNDFMSTVFDLKPGDVSKLIATPDAFYIVKVVDVYKQRSLTLDDEIQPGTATTMREYIKAGLLQEKQQAVLKTIQDELVAELSKGNPYSVNEKYISF